jgi:hypothetical protein
VILEVLSARGGAVHTRVRLAALPFTIGRSLDNDLIVDDPYLDARHARVVRVEDGSLVLEDLGSRNGLLVGRAQGWAASVPVRGGLEAQLGRTTLRFRDPEEQVPPALALPSGYAGDPTRRWVDGPLGRVALLGAIALVAAYTWLHSYERSRAEDAVTLATGLVAMGVAWAGLWSLAGRVAVHRFEFRAHLAVFALGAIALMAAGVVDQWAIFLFPGSAVVRTLSVVVLFVLTVGWLAAHLAFVSRLAPLARLRAAFAIAAVAYAAFGGLSLIGGEDFSDIPEFSSMTKPLGPRWVPTMDVDEFVQDADELKGEVDDLVPSG